VAVESGISLSNEEFAMKIAAAGLELAAFHHSSSKVEVEERLSAWVGRRQPSRGNGDGAQASRSVLLSDAGRQALSSEKGVMVGASAPVSGDELESDPKLELLKAIVEMLTGERIDMMSASDVAPNGPPAAPAAPVPEFGLEYDRTETRQTSEETGFEASGTIRTADGKDIQFSVGLFMSRSETQTSSFSLRAGNAVNKDPLVVNFGGNAASLRNQRFKFDLMGDGRQVDVPLLGQGSGFLVLDAAGSGKVASGKQLFGPASGDGFADLAKYDSDSNGWIDEADPVFERLGVWTPDAKGGGAVASLASAGVGALYLGHSATPFTLKDGAELGAVRSSGIFAREDGSVGTLQQVDLKV
jgi:hypothetical protein